MPNEQPESDVKMAGRNLDDVLKMLRENKIKGLIVIGRYVLAALAVAVPLALSVYDRLGFSHSAESSSSNTSPLTKVETLTVRQAPAEASKVDGSISPPSRSLQIQNGEVLVLKSKQGMAAIAISFAPGCRASYQWRYKPVVGAESNGAGELYEQYGVAQKPNELTDLNGKLVLKAGPLSAEWSCGTESSGWIYQSPDSQAYLSRATDLSQFRL
jgi:hypothetical protein